MTTVTFRTDEKLKADATKVFEGLEMNLSQAINLFLRQTVIQQRFPCSLEGGSVNDTSSTYPPEFFAAFGSGTDIEEPEDPAFIDEKDFAL